MLNLLHTLDYICYATFTNAVMSKVVPFLLTTQPFFHAEPAFPVAKRFAFVLCWLGRASCTNRNISSNANFTNVLQCQPSANLSVCSRALRLLLGPEDTGLLSCWLHPGMNKHHLSCYVALSLMFIFCPGSSLALPQNMCLVISIYFLVYQGEKICPKYTHILPTSVTVSRTSIQPICKHQV